MVDVVQQYLCHEHIGGLSIVQSVHSHGILGDVRRLEYGPPRLPIRGQARARGRGSHRLQLRLHELSDEAVEGIRARVVVVPKVLGLHPSLVHRRQRAQQHRDVPRLGQVEKRVQHSRDGCRVVSKMDAEHDEDDLVCEGRSFRGGDVLPSARDAFRRDHLEGADVVNSPLGTITLLIACVQRSRVESAGFAVMLLGTVVVVVVADAVSFEKPFVLERVFVRPPLHCSAGVVAHEDAEQ